MLKVAMVGLFLGAAGSQALAYQINVPAGTKSFQWQNTCTGIPDSLGYYLESETMDVVGSLKCNNIQFLQVKSALGNYEMVNANDVVNLN